MGKQISYYKPDELQERKEEYKKKVAAIWASESFDECDQLCEELFNMGFDDGQTYVWASRAGSFYDEEGTSVDHSGNPREPNHPMGQIFKGC